MDDEQQAGRRSSEPPPGTAATSAWFEQLESLLARLVAAHDAASDPGGPREPGDPGAPAVGTTIVGPDEQMLLLDLARIAARGSERWTAPVSTYLVGVALAPYAPAVRAQVLTDLVDGLEPDAH